jgi:radical SAM PhpK family P-methyltransferase
LDCILIGYNEVDLESLIKSRKSMARGSGVFRELMTNTVQIGGTWMHYMDLLNIILNKNTDQCIDFHLMEMPNLGVCYLESFLSKRGHQVESIGIYNNQKDRLVKLLKQSPSAVAITTTFYAETGPIQDIVRFIKQHNRETIVIVGGPYIFNICNWHKDETTLEYLLDSIGADIYIFDSQGEDSLSNLLYEIKKTERPNLENLPNLIFKKQSHITFNNRVIDTKNSNSTFPEASYIRTQRRAEDNNLDENAIDWSLFSSSSYAPTAQMRTGRGCSFSCAFCSFPILAGAVRFAKLDTIEKEMKQLHAGGVKNLIFIDDTLNVPPVRFKKILKMMIDNQFKFNWFSYFRCGSADDETFDLMKESGCKAVFLGLESGDQRILDNMNKQVSISQYEHGLRKLHEQDIITFASFIVGFPGETEETIQNTIHFIQKNKPTYYKAQIYYHANDVPINREAEKYGLRSSGYSWRHSTMDWRVACDMVEMMYKTIKGSFVCPLFMFDFWAIPYLFGKGIQPTHFKEFLSLSQKLLAKNFDAASLSAIEEERIVQKLFMLGEKMFHSLGAKSGHPR